MKNLKPAAIKLLVGTGIIILIFGCQDSKINQASESDAGVKLWLTTPDKKALFQRQDTTYVFGDVAGDLPVIAVNEKQTYQELDGFGYTLTGGSAMLLHRMKPAAKSAILNELFSTNAENIGVSYLRISIGASDLDARVFSYNDLPAGKTDPNLNKFSLAPDHDYLIPLLKEILMINPKLKIMGSPWSPPPWMKTNNNSKGGSLKPEWYGAYAQYLVKYITSMQAEGIRIDAITIQNEPLHPGNNPSLLMLPEEQATFIKNNLGPAFTKANLSTKIIIYDHNADRPDYPITILNDPAAKKYVDGSAFHLYGGNIEALTQVHEAHPDKHIYFTEQWTGAPGNFAGDFAWHVRTLIIGATRNWARTVLEWNLAADPQQKPHTPGGCTACLGALTIAGDSVIRNSPYYVIAHAAKFVRPGALRIASTMPDKLPNVAFITPVNQKVLIVQNDNPSPQTFNIIYGGKAITTTLPAGAAGTYVWK